MAAWFDPGRGFVVHAAGDVDKRLAGYELLFDPGRLDLENAPQLAGGRVRVDDLAGACADGREFHGLGQKPAVAVEDLASLSPIRLRGLCWRKANRARSGPCTI
jgi:hypothetical protein